MTKNKLTILLFIFLILSLLPIILHAQKSADTEKALYRADKLFEIKNYKAALPIYLEIEPLLASDPLINYRIGVCYSQEPEINNQLKAIPYLTKAIVNKNETIPSDVYFYIGKAYHKDVRLAEAIESFTKYKKTIPASEKKKLAEVDAHLGMCNNAALLMGKQKTIEIKNMGSMINSEYTEYNPVVSADEGLMAYTALRPNKDKMKSGLEFTEEIYITYKTKTSAWENPKPLKLINNSNVGTAGLTADGEKMIVFIGASNNTGNLFIMEKSGTGWGNPVNMGSNVNSNYLESTASITPDGKTIYFASNRIGGFGGMDIYKVEKNAKGVFGQPENLGAAINTSKDEDAPFIHPDQKTLFFTSDGHNTMGGKDIFKTVLTEKKFSKPENMGYPINTPANDNYFTLTADGRKGYFSSDRKGGYGGQDIYTFDMPEEDANIPLTLVKGRILAGDDLQPVPTTIKIVDNSTSQKVDYVYNPNKETGDYLIIFPPGKNYDMVIESEGYMPYAININIPDQTYFYELYQQIHLKPIKQFDVVVGQEVIVKNAFFDTKTTSAYDLKKANESMLIQSDSVDVLELMDAIIASNDQVAYEYLLELMFNTNPIDGVNFNENEQVDIEAAKRVYYFDESEEKDLEAKTIGEETIFTLPTMYVTELAKQQKKKEIIEANFDKKLLDPVYKLYFDIGKSDMKQSYLTELDKVMLALKAHENLGIEISGYASSEGDAETNRALSNKRAIEVLNYFNHKGVVRRRIIAKGYGATKNEKNNLQEGRRVEIRIIDLNKI